MKVMIRKSEKGISAYIAKKDLEQPIIATERPELWGGWVKLGNGWVLDLPEMMPAPRLPVTVNARKRGEDS